MLTAAIGTRINHISNHLSPLRSAKLVVYERAGSQHLYHLTPAARVEFARAAIEFRLQADDGALLAFTVPWDSVGSRALGLKREDWERR